jgi:hypothetical protein
VIEYVEPPEPAVTGGLAGIDADLLGEASDFMDDVQGALEEVSQLTDLIANVPSFGDPTTRIEKMPAKFNDLLGGDTLKTLTSLSDLF